MTTVAEPGSSGVAVVALGVVEALVVSLVVRAGTTLTSTVAEPTAAGHHGGGLVGPSPIAGETVLHFIGFTVFTAQLTIVTLLVTAELARLGAVRWKLSEFGAQLSFAIAAVAAAGFVWLPARSVMNSTTGSAGLPLAELAEVLRYCFAAALVVALLRTVPWHRVRRDSSSAPASAGPEITPGVVHGYQT